MHSFGEQLLLRCFGVLRGCPRAAGEIANCTSWYVPKDSDTCESVLRRTRLTLEQFHTYNPSVKTDCTGLLADVFVCVGLAASPTTNPTPATTTTAAGVSTPTPIQDGMTTTCSKFYFVQSGDGCWAISDANGIALDDFYAWNPAVKTDCTGLQANVYVCIAVA
ncbi:LysM domain-containing protein [Colletotrichum camelliae]|nr:LysM domain-containing protein [Colletotrichum camelliae]